MVGHIPTPTTSMSGLRLNNDDFHLVILQFEELCRVSAHEVGHTLGLVDTIYLAGVGKMHNSGGEDQTKIMNINTDIEWMFNAHLPIGWRTLNSQYLEFVLPIPK